MRFLLYSLVCCLAFMSRASAQTQNTRHEVIRGTITGPNSTPLPGVQVVATRAPDRASKFAKTDSLGRYVLDWPDGTGDYLVHLSLPGYETIRKRVTAVPGGDTVFVVDATLAAQQRAQVLEPVVATARKPKPTRANAFGADVGASEQLSGGLVGTLPPDLAGDLAAIAGTLPGVMTTADGMSVFGLGPSQNSTTLNGLAFAGADIPRDAATRVRVSGSAYDPARGWFSGANTNVELAPGNIFGRRTSHITLDAPALQYNDRISSRLGQRYTSGQLSTGGDGELVDDKWYYNYGAQGGRRYADPASILTADSDLLRHSGVAIDSVERLTSLLRAAEVPISRSSSSAVTDNASLIARFDHAPYDPVTLGSAKSTWGIIGYGKLARSTALSTSPLATPAHTGKSAQTIGTLQGEYSTFFGADYLATLRSSVSYRRNETSPYLALPDAQVRVQSLFDDGTGGIGQLAFGGNAGLNSDNRLWTWENTGDVQFFVRQSPRHRVRLGADIRYDGFSIDAAPNSYGSFSYNSLADVAARTPAAFTRTVSSPTRQGGEWNGFLAISDLWRRSPRWQVMYGARIEGNAFTAIPAYNADVDRIFGARTDVGPASLHISPRLGFTFNRTGMIRNTDIGSPLGTFYGTAPGVLRGGIGEFRSLTPPTLLANALIATGLPGGVSRVACVGSAVPIPDWSAYAASPSAIPTSCANGAPSSFTDAAPTVQMFDRQWAPSRSWRGNLSWSSAWRWFNYSLEGVYSLNLNQPGLVDLNFADAPRFTLPIENRPMFVQPSSIVPATGRMNVTDARASSLYGHVLQSRGDGRSTSRQLTFAFSPNLVDGNFRNSYLSLGYTLSSIRTRQRGFDAATFGSPTTREWARGDLDARHQLILQTGYTRQGLTFSLHARAQSGLPFTPIVDGDINGDGLANDRAFVFDPSATGDPALSRGMRDLVSSSSGSVADCIESQIGRAATRASCEGPWTTFLNARLGLSGRTLKLGRRVDVGINFANPLGGLDQLLHGANGLRGWGTQAAPDPVLYAVRGYDATAGRFLYDVNPRFGSTRASSNTIRAPFRVTLDVSVDVGRPLEEQEVDRWLKPGRSGKAGPKLTANDLKRRYERNVPDPYRPVLQQTDSLLLSREQVESLQRVQAAYRVRMDSLWRSLAEYLATLPDRYEAREAYRRANKTIEEGWEVSRIDVQKNLRAILNQVQLQMLPNITKLLYTADRPLQGIRIFIAGGD